MSENVKIMLVDDHALLLESLAMRLRAESNLEIIATAANADEALEKIRTQCPDVLLMDIDMPGMSCFDAAKRIMMLDQGIKVVFLSAHWNDHYIEQAIAGNAHGYLTKSESPRMLIDAIKRIAAGETVYSSDVESRIIGQRQGSDDQPRTRLSKLSPREKEVLCYIAQSLSRRDIAKTMHISDKTVAAHTSSIMSKLDLHDRVELARFAIREGMVKL